MQAAAQRKKPVVMSVVMMAKYASMVGAQPLALTTNPFLAKRGLIHGAAQQEIRVALLLANAA